MFQTTHRMSVIVHESKLGPVLRLLCAHAGSAQVVAPKDYDASQETNFAVFVTLVAVPTPSEINALKSAGARLPEKTLTGLKEAWMRLLPDEDAELELLLSASEIKRSALKRARRRPEADPEGSGSP